MDSLQLNEIKKKLVAKGLMKEDDIEQTALVNPGGVSFDVGGGGASTQLPQGRRPETYQMQVKDRAPSDKNVMKKLKDNQKLLDMGDPSAMTQNDLAQQLRQKQQDPGMVTKEFDRFTGPMEQRKKDNQFSKYDKTPLRNPGELQRLYPSLFEDGVKPVQEEYQGRHEAPTSKFEMFTNFLRGLLPRKRQQAPVTASLNGDLLYNLCEALLVEDDFFTVTASLTEAGFAPGQVLDTIEAL